MNTPANKGQKLPPEPLTADEMNSLLRTCSHRAPTGIRNKALIVILWRAGLRCTEALSILPKDLDHAHGTIRVLMGKGKRSRVVGLDPEAWAVLQRWLDRRHELGINGRSPVFCTLRGEPLSPQYVRNLLPRLARKANIEKRVHAHGLRHTHAFELANEATPIHVIQQQLGHSSLATTDRYIRHLNPQQVVDAMQARCWNRT
jgi:site-specific recombinase XerD